MVYIIFYIYIYYMGLYVPEILGQVVATFIQQQANEHYKDGGITRLFVALTGL